jgi:hypothetical protein
MSTNRKPSLILVAVALLLSALMFGGQARAESAYPAVQDMPPKRDQPAMTVNEQSKLKKELMNARDRQTPKVEDKGGAARAKGKRP